jgi:hypothetical protein
MTASQKNIVLHLFKGCYLMRSLNTNGTPIFKLYQPGQKLISYSYPSDIKPITELLKEDQNRRFTLNLKIVRKLHGKTYVKTIYKKRKILPVMDIRTPCSFAYLKIGDVFYKSKNKTVYEKINSNHYVEKNTPNPVAKSCKNLDMAAVFLRHKETAFA